MSLFRNYLLLFRRHPGPGAYGAEKQLFPKRIKSANAKGTFPLSKRTYLVSKKIE